MSVVQLGIVNDAVLTMTVNDSNQRVTDGQVDAQNATAPVHLFYPEDGHIVDLVIQPGQLLSRSFVGGNQLSRLTEQRIRPGDGATVTVWVSPGWLFLGV